jgi:hypothetical protein
MKLRNPLRRIRIERLALLAALLVVVRVLGWELHQLTAPHVPGETCEVCLVGERGGDAIPAAATGTPALPQAAAPFAAFSRLPRATVAPCPPARGPPSSQA